MILVTGGSGFIGSHVCLELLAAGRDVVVIDSLCNSSSQSLVNVQKLTNRKLSFVEGDVRDEAFLSSVFGQYRPTAVLHFAGLKSVGESVTDSLRYYDNNVSGTICLLKVMADYSCRDLVFSSSATVYGDPASTPIRESFPLTSVNPYGGSKLMAETILRDLVLSDERWRIAILRYFNPVGAHESGLVGEDPLGIPNNLFPYVVQVATGQRKVLKIFGSDYPTLDGTGIRDYIHVEDLARGHLCALEALTSTAKSITVNLGTGRGYSVLEVVDAFERVSGRNIPYEFVDRRTGDVAKCFADPSYAKKVLKWQSKHGLQRMCEDAWRWQVQNPNGYRGVQ